MAITADVSCRLLEVDFAGIEGIIVGRCLWKHAIDPDGAPQYIRLARNDIHSAVTAMMIGQTIDLTADEDSVRAQLAAIKKAHAFERDLAKRVVHGSNYGLTTFGLVEKFPEFFPNLKAAQKVFDAYHALAPGLPKWHTALRKQARDTGFLGGPTLPGAVPAVWDHEYGYRHWFWDVLSYQPCDEFTARKWLKDPSRRDRIVQMHGRWFKVRYGGDSNRVVSFYPQSLGAGRLKEAQLRLFLPWSDDYIGDCYFGRTPLLGPIHDSLLLHVPNRCWDRVVEIVARVMQEPSPYLPIPREWAWGPNLPIGVAAKAGRNWAPSVDEDEQIKIQIKTDVRVPLNPSGMDEIEIPEWVPSSGADDPVFPREDATDRPTGSQAQKRGAQMKYRGQPIEVDAIQWAGDNLAALQAFLAPQQSPLINLGPSSATKPLCGVYVRDRYSEATYPSLGTQYKLEHAHVGDWVLKTVDGEISIVSDVEFQQRYMVVAVVDGEAADARNAAGGSRELMAPIAPADLPRPSWEQDARAAQPAAGSAVNVDADASADAAPVIF